MRRTATAAALAVLTALGVLPAAAPASAAVAAAMPATVPATVPATLPAVATTGALATAPLAGAARVRLVLSASYLTIRPGTTVTLRATYMVGKRPVARTRLRLQREVDGRWRTLRTLRSDAKGKASTKVSPTTTTRYRLIAMSGKTRSAVTTVRIHPSVTMTSKATTITAGASATITGTYRTDGRLVASGKLKLQEERDGVWRKVRTVTVTKGKASTTVSPTATTRYRWRALTGAQRSDPVTVTVKAPAAPAAPTPTTAPSTSPVTVPGSLVAQGSGYGHGVGMSQYGAYQMAREGHDVIGILTHYYQGTTVTPVTVPATVAVQVLGPEPYSFSGYADTAATTTFSVDTGSWRLRGTTADGAGANLATGAAGEPVVLSVVDGKPVATVRGTTFPDATWTGRRDVLRLHWSGTDYFDAAGAKAVASLTGAQGRYRHGRLTVTVIGGRLNVVNELDLTRQYLYGIAEMPSGWGSNGGSAALSAQAVTARSYALAKMGVTAAKPDGTRNARCNCHVVDDVRDQSFTGWRKEGEGLGGRDGLVWQRAVDNTVRADGASLVLTHAGAPVTAHYYSSSGGRTSNSEDVWSAVVPYERSVEDSFSLRAPGNTRASWSVPVTQARLAALFKVPDVVAVTVTETYSSGQVRTLTATTASGATATATGKADVLRSALGLPAAWVTSFTTP